MSYVKNVTLFCDGTTADGEPCPEAYGEGVVITTARKAREDASEQGWTNDGAEDYCPECSGNTEETA